MAHRRTGRRGLRVLAGGVLIAGLVISPAATQARTGPGTNHMTATRVARVDPLREGVARSGGAGASFGVPAGTGDQAAGLQSLRRPGATVPGTFNLPRWLPQHTHATASGRTPSSVPLALARSAASGPSISGAGATVAAASVPGAVGLRSEFGTYGLSDADDSLLYPDCSTVELCEEPPDPGVAASATNVMQSVNELMLIVDRRTNDSRVIPNFDFFSLDNNQVTQSDPRVLYDLSRHRWLATEISSDCAHSYLHVAVSSSDDPLAAWTVYRIVFPGRVVDFPGVGTANDTVVVGLNSYSADPASPDCLSGGEFEGAMLLVADWSDLESTVPSLPVTTTAPDVRLFTWRPATAPGGDLLARLVVGIDNGTHDTADVGYATLSGTNAGRNVTLSPVVNLTRTRGLATLVTPPAPRQPGKPATIERAVDGDLTDAIAASGHLWFIATAACTPAGDDAVRDCVRVTELATGATGADVAVESDIRLQERGADLFMGGLGRALDGTLYVVYSRSSATDEIAAWSTWRRPDEAAFHDPVELIPAGGVYSGTRWGDYVILAPDPANPEAVWQSHEVASVDGTWFTWLSRIRPAPQGPMEGTFTINGGDAFAGETFVELQLATPADVAVTVVRVSNRPAVAGGVLAGGITMPVADLVPWSLVVDEPEGGPPDGTRQVYLQWGDGQGHWSAVATKSIVLDTTGPTMGAVAAPRIGTSTMGRTGTVPVEIRWQGSRDALSGLEGYDVQVSRDDADWEDVGTRSTPSVTVRVAAGHRYQWRVRSFDRVSNVSDWADGPTVRIDAFDDASAVIHYDSGWRRSADPSAYRGGVHGTATAGAAATVSFIGRGFAIVGTVGPGHGTIDVYVDGTRVGRFDESQATTRAGRIGLARLLAVGRHTVRLVAAGGGPVDLDAVVLVR